MYSKKPLFSAMLLLAIFIFSCAGKKSDSYGHDHHEGEGENAWEDMDRFHMIMAETYHPYRDSSNLEPARARAAELMTAADEWASASLPEKVNNAEVRSKLQKLRSEAVALAESVKSADDNVVGGQLTMLHHTFHEIEEAWYRGR